MPNENDSNNNGYRKSGSPSAGSGFYSPDELNNMLNGIAARRNSNAANTQKQTAKPASNPYTAEPVTVSHEAYRQRPVSQPVQQPVRPSQPAQPVQQQTYRQPAANTQTPAPSVPAQQAKTPFRVSISDDDYNAPDELDIKIGKQAAPAEKPKFEVHIEDDDELIDFGNEQPSYQEPVRIGFDKPLTPAQPAEPEKKNSAKPKKKKTKQRNPYSALILFIAIVTVLTTAVSAIGISCINDILAFSRKDNTVTVTIPADATTDEVIDILSDSKLVKQKWFCKLYNYAFTTLLNKSDKEYKGGVYYVDGNLGLEGYLTEFSTTQTGAKTYMVTIPEGYTIYQIAERLDNFGICDESKFLASIKGTSFSYSFIKDIDADSDRTFTLEGYLYPDTYEFYEDDDPNSVIRKMLDRSDEIWTDEYQQRADELGYTRDEIMIIASIVQREAANVEQMDEISSIIHNRLSKPASWPSIDCDSTSTYISRYIAPNVSNGEASRYTNAYNTYSIKGLPPGPICNPGDDAIRAALWPSDTNYYFFRHDNSGKIYLASTQAEHDANANLVLKANNGS